METTTKATGITPATFENVQNAINTIKSWASEKNYLIDGDLSLNESEMSDVISKMSKTQKKKLGRSLYRATNMPSLYSTNILLHVLYKKLLKRDKCPKIKVSEREQQIKDARKKWVTARNLAATALAEYKEIKGDFYKSK